MVLLSGVLYSNYNLIMNHKKLQPSIDLTSDDYRAASVISSSIDSLDTIRIRIAAKTEKSIPRNTGIFHVMVKDDSCQIARPYTPIAYDDNSIELLVKKYGNGSVSRHIHSLQKGDMMHVRGPIQTLPYKPNIVENLAMIAGGTGIAPMYQMIHRILNNPEDKTKIHLVFASRNPESIHLKHDLDLLQKTRGEQLNITYLVDQDDQQPVEHDWHVGRLDRETLAKLIPDASTLSYAVLVSGPDGMINSIAGPKISETVPGPLGGVLKQLGFKDSQVVKL